MDTNHLDNVSSIDTLRILRRQAEDIVSGQVAVATAKLKALSPAVVLKLMQELQVHQIELEMQNEELRKTQLVELTRLDGHLIVMKEGVRNAKKAQSQAALSGAISPANDRFSRHRAKTQ